MSELPPLKLRPELEDRRITADYVADALREAIHSGALPDGAILNQVSIAQQLGVSRVPVREAMRQLQAEGLVSAESYRRAVVRSLSIDRIMELYDIRALLEVYMLEHAVPNIDEERLRTLRELEEQMQGVEDHARWLELNGRFHFLLYEPSGAATALELSEQLRTRSERYVNLWTSGTGMQRNEEAGREHRRILRHVAKGDAAAASAELQKHIAHTRERLLRLHEARERAAEQAGSSSAA